MPVADSGVVTRAKLMPIAAVGERLGIPEAALELYGRYKAKISLDYIAGLQHKPLGKLILVTAMTPTPAGEGKTTTSIGLGDALSRLGKRAIICLRQPSVGPVFGMKGGATGGGGAQVAPMEEINLNFTGDFSSIALANNLLAAAIDNHIHHGNELGIDVRRITWRRVMDINDRALREIVVSLGNPPNGYPRQDGFDIVVASEVMAVFCLATSLKDLRTRLGNMVVGYTRDQRPVRARDLKVHGAMAVMLKSALAPNLVQTLENTPALIHGGPFANIAHGCNSVLATSAALRMADYVVTEAGFGADLGAEKFVNIKCRKSGLKPSAAVVVATIRALKYHGGVGLEEIAKENLSALTVGIANLERHIDNVRNQYGLPCIVAVNCFDSDTPAELKLLQNRLAPKVSVVCASHWLHGGQGAEELAAHVLDLVEGTSADLRLSYEDETPLWDKMISIATSIYGASGITGTASVRRRISQLEEDGYRHYPICTAKTQYSFSTDPKLRGAPEGHVVNVREVRLAAGAEFIVMICGDVMTMPGMPKVPAAERIDLADDGSIVGLF